MGHMTGQPIYYLFVSPLDILLNSMSVRKSARKQSLTCIAPTKQVRHCRLIWASSCYDVMHAEVHFRREIHRASFLESFPPA